MLLQTQLLDKQASIHCTCNKVPVKDQSDLKCFENYEKEFNTSNKNEYLEHEDILKSKNNDSCIIIEPVSKLLQ